MTSLLGFEGLVLPDLVLRAGGDRLDAIGALADVDPCTGVTFAQIPVAGAEAVDAVVDASCRAFHDPAWRDLMPLARERLLHRLADAMEADLPRLAALEALDTGKPIGVVEGVDVPAAIAWLRVYAGWPTKLAGRAGTLSATPGAYHVYSRREPVGVVAAITPWNFPLVLAMWKIAPALAAGCTVILKPAPETPLSALRLVELARQAGLPEGVLSVVTGDSATGAALAAHHRISKVAFTGSTTTGQAILSASVPDLKRVTLELGGKSPSIICADADLDLAIARAAMGCFFNAGQVCYAGTRLYVHRSVYDRVLDGIAAVGSALPMGRSADRAAQLGPLISERQHARVTGFVERARAAGLEAMPVRTDLPGEGYYFAPTVLRDVPPDAEVARDEVFGPVLATAPFDDLDEAIARANHSPFGLAAHVFTRDLATAHRSAAAIAAGTVFINCVMLADPAFPFGGMKMSGIGRENGSEALDAYLEPKSVIMAL
jgi:acyl-CoA reductase-like NAD-dependent aldehyde dehydrogenase